MTRLVLLAIGGLLSAFVALVLLSVLDLVDEWVITLPDPWPTPDPAYNDTGI